MSRELEMHMSHENFPFLRTVQNAHIVANYWKKVLFEMKTPLIPTYLYEDFGKIRNTDGPDQLVQQIRELVEQMPQINQNTLDFFIEFLEDVIKFEK